MIVADASWVIALQDPNDPHHEQAAELNVSSAGETILLHAVTLAECLVGAAKLGELATATRQLHAAFEIVAIDPDAPPRWAQLRATSALRLPDAIVLDTALNRAATTILTFDQRLATVAAQHSITTPL